MPIYEYRRPDGSTFEVMQKFSDPALTEDPETGVPVSRVFRPPAIHFKGSGFHNTDYGTRKRKAEGEGGGSGEGGGGGDGDKASSGSDDGAKPAAKGEAKTPSTSSSSSSSSSEGSAA
jgi:putative FmdB family regulatory protein